jgi:hypothetical protein
MNAHVQSVYPLPEAVEEAKRKKPWQIEPSGSISPRVQLSAGVLIVPLDESDQSRFIRDHELGHVRWSPHRPDQKAARFGVSSDVLQAVEDMRVNTKLAAAGVDTSASGWSEDVCQAIARDVLRRNEARMTVLMAVAAQGSGLMEQTFRDVLEQTPMGASALEVARLARQALWSAPVPKFRDTIRVALWLQSLLDCASAPKPVTEGASSSGGKAESLGAALQVARNHGVSRRSTKKIPWGKMRVDTPMRPNRVLGYLGKRHRATDEGSYPRHLYRQLIDGKVFRHVRRGRGGTVLIDASGSMQLSQGDIASILKAAPGCTVAVYSGNTHDGVLRVLACNGRQVDSENVRSSAGGANVIDGPALQWLSKQQKPRIWVSDGQVTGIRDQMSAVNTLECMTLARRHQIARAGDVRAGVKLLGQLSRHRQ